MSWRYLVWLVALTATTPSPVVSQEPLKLRIPSPVASWRLSPTIGVAEDSLTRRDGVWIHDIQPGSSEPTQTGDRLTVHFVAFLTNGKIFSATNADPFKFVLGEGQVIDGWEQGLLGMKVGGRRQILVPAHLGYGAEGDGAVPPDAPLVFDVTLIDVEKR